MRRVICLITLVAFICTSLTFDLACAVSDTKSPVSDTKAILIPSHLGSVKDSWLSPKAGAPMVIYIQDAHCNYRAQQAIAELVKYFAKTYGVATVDLEGGEGAYDLSAFSRIADADIREKTADYLVRQGVLNGAELCAIRDPGAVILRGVEDTALYRENLAVYRAALRHGDEVSRGLKEIGYALSLVKSRVYPKNLIAFDLQVNSFHAQAIDLKEYCAYLVRYAAEKSVDVADLNAIVLLGKTLSLEKGIDFKRSNAERDELIDKLTKYQPKMKAQELAERSVAFKMGRMTPSAFYSFLFEQAKNAAIDVNVYKDLAAYVRYVSAYDAVGKDALFGQIDLLESRIREMLFTAPVQRDLDRITKDLGIIRHIFSTMLTPDEYREYTTRKADFDFTKIADTIRAAAAGYAIDTPLVSDTVNTVKLTAYLGEMERFYALSYKRDDAFLRVIARSSEGATKQSLNGEIASPPPGARNDNVGQTSILITGGFHTDNLTKRFKERGISYISVMPTFTLDDTPCPYFSLLAGEQPAFLRSVTSAMSTMAIYGYFCEESSPMHGHATVQALNDAIASGDVPAMDHPPAPVSSSPAADTSVFVFARKVVKRAVSLVFGVLKILLGKKTVRAILGGALALQMSVSSFAEVVGAPSARPDTQGTQIASQAPPLFENDVNKQIFEGHNAVKDMDELWKKFTLTKEFVDKIPQKTVELYRDLAAKAGVSVDVFLALELVETSGQAVLNPANKKAVVSRANAQGPIQVMPGDCKEINGYIKLWEKEARKNAVKNAVKAEAARLGKKSLTQDERAHVEKNTLAALSADTVPALLSSLDTKKYRVILRFLGFGKQIDLDKINPKLEKYDPNYARMVGALILAMKARDINDLRFDVTNGKYELVKKTALHQGEDPGFDSVLVAIASYSAGPIIAFRALEATGPQQFYKDKRLWYVKYLDSLERIQRAQLAKNHHSGNLPEAPQHNARSRMYDIFLDIFAAAMDAPESLNGIEEGSMFEESLPPLESLANPAGATTPSLEPDLPSLIEADIEELLGPSVAAPEDVLQDAGGEEGEAESPAVDEQQDVLASDSPVQADQVEEMSYSLNVLGAAAGAVVSTLVALAGRFFGLQWLRNAVRRVRGAFVDRRQIFPPLEAEDIFMGGRIFDKENIERERSDNRFTVVFDLDKTLISSKTWPERDLTEIDLRDGVIDMLLVLRQRGAKLVLWTCEKREWVKEVFKLYPELKDCFDLAITQENYLDPELMPEDERDEDDTIVGHLKSRLLTKENLAHPIHALIAGEYLKDIGLLGYDVLVDDKPQTIDTYYTKRHWFSTSSIVIPMHGKVEMKVNSLLKFRALLVKPHDPDAPGAGTGIEMMQALAVILKLMPPPPHAPRPGAAGQIGHDAKLTNIVEKDEKRFAEVLDSKGIEHFLELARLPQPDLFLEKKILNGLIKKECLNRRPSIETSPDADAEYKNYVVDTLIDLFGTPAIGVRPEFCTFGSAEEKDRIDDFLGFSSRDFGYIGLHNVLWTDPIAHFHEIVEYLGESGAATPLLDGNVLEIRIVGAKPLYVPLSAGALAIARKGDGDPSSAQNRHYLWWALARECFGEDDKALSRKIAENKAIEDTVVSRPLDIPEDVRNILVYASDGGESPKRHVGESSINQAPLVAGLMDKFPDATIYVVTDHPAMYLSGYFQGRVVPFLSDEFRLLSGKAADLRRAGYTIETMTGANEQTRLRFLQDHAVDLIFDLSNTGDVFRSRPGCRPDQTMPYLFEIGPVAHLSSEANGGVFLSAFRGDRALFYDGEGHRYHVSYDDQDVPAAAPEKELRLPDALDLAVSLYRQLGLDIGTEDIGKSRAHRLEAANVFQSLLNELGPDNHFERKKMLFTIYIHTRMTTDEILLRTMEERDRMQVSAIIRAFKEQDVQPLDVLPEDLERFVSGLSTKQLGSLRRPELVDILKHLSEALGHIILDSSNPLYYDLVGREPLVSMIKVSLLEKAYPDAVAKAFERASLDMLGIMTTKEFVAYAEERHIIVGQCAACRCYTGTRLLGENHECGLSHGLCPDCAKEVYVDMDNMRKEKGLAPKYADYGKNDEYRKERLETRQKRDEIRAALSRHAALMGIDHWVEVLTAIASDNDNAYLVVVSDWPPGERPVAESVAGQVYDDLARCLDGGHLANVFAPQLTWYQLHGLLALSDAVVTDHLGIAHHAAVNGVPALVMGATDSGQALLMDRSPLSMSEPGDVASAESTQWLSRFRGASDKARTARGKRAVSNMNTWKRALADSRLVDEESESPEMTSVAVEDLTIFIKEYLGELDFDAEVIERLMPKIVFVDSAKVEGARRIDIGVPRFRMKLSNVGDDVYLLVDRSVLDDRQNKDAVVRDDVKRNDVVHEISHQLVRETYPVFVNLYAEARNTGKESKDLMVMKVKEELLARFITRAAQAKVMALHSSFAPSTFAGFPMMADGITPDIGTCVKDIIKDIKEEQNSLPSTARYQKYLLAHDVSGEMMADVQAKAAEMYERYFSVPVAMTPAYIEEASQAIAGMIKNDSYALRAPCTIGVVVKAEPGAQADLVIEEQFAAQMESVGRNIGRKVPVMSGVARYEDADNVAYVVYVDDGTDTAENRTRLAAFKKALVGEGSGKERTFAWILSADERRGSTPAEIGELQDAAYLVALKGDYLPSSWQMLAGPLFANLIDSRSMADVPPDRVNAIVDAIITALIRMTGKPRPEWAALEQELRDPAINLARTFDGSLTVTLPPIVPETSSIESCRKADLSVRTAL